VCGLSFCVVVDCMQDTVGFNFILAGGFSFRVGLYCMGYAFGFNFMSVGCFSFRVVSFFIQEMFRFVFVSVSGFLLLDGVCFLSVSGFISMVCFSWWQFREVKNSSSRSFLSSRRFRGGVGGCSVLFLISC